MKKETVKNIYGMHVMKSEGSPISFYGYPKNMNNYIHEVLCMHIRWKGVSDNIV
jgi:hypothetical protein